MLHTLHSPETLYAAYLANDLTYDGHAYICITTTGIFCRFTCTARKPKFENTRFFPTISECAAAGFRPCLRCKPLNHLTSRDPVIADLLRKLHNNPEQKWSEADLIALGYDPSTIRRIFKRNVGMTFLDLARLHRTGLGLESLATGAPAIEAQLDASYHSASGFRAAVMRLIGDTPAALKGRDLLKAAWLDTPIGQMLAIADAHRLHLLEFFDRKALPAELFSVRTRNRSAISLGRTSAIDSVERELASYFHGTLQTFTTPLALEHTAFTRNVWNHLIQIPYGTTTSYGALAATIGQPTAARAVARANGTNQLAIIIPCHRVIGADGSLTGYGGKLWRKQWLLEHEAKHAHKPAP